MIAVNPYLNFNGRTGEAMKFYAQCLGADLEMQTFKDMGMGGPGTEDRILHARLSKGGESTVIMASDSQPGQDVTIGDNIWLSVNCDSNEEQDRMFKALSEGGKVVMPLDVQFWGARFGMLKDKFGVGWMFNAEQQK